jgi:hypothetical protein
LKDKLNIVLIGILVFLALYGISDWRSHRAKLEIEEAQENTEPEQVQVLDKSLEQATSEQSQQLDVEAVEKGDGQALNRLSDAQIQEKFSKAVSDASTCLALKAGQGFASTMEPTLDNWLTLVKQDLGDQVLQTEDWSTINLVTGSGEKRKIRIEMDYSGNDRIVRRLKYYRGDEGKLEQIPLSAEQTEDPSETFIASLESDGQISSREVAQRIYFSGGEEILVTEKNSKISELTMSRNGRTFQCSLFDPNPQSCRCTSTPPIAEDGP